MTTPNTGPFASAPVTSATHFKLYYFAAVLHIIDWLAQRSETSEDLLERFPFLAGYMQELALAGLDGRSTSETHAWWRERLLDWEARAPVFLPLRSMRASAGLAYETMVGWFCIGLPEEDPRFAAVYGSAPTFALLNSWSIETGAWHLRARDALRQLQSAHLIHVPNPDALQVDWILQPDPLLWDILSTSQACMLRGGLTYRPPEVLPSFEQLVLSPELHQQLERTPAVLASGEIETLVIRGPRHNGRHAMLGAIAKHLGQGVLELTGPKCDELAGPLATLLHALPVMACELAPGETIDAPHLDAYTGPVGVVMGRQGGIRDAGRILTLYSDMPLPTQRVELWADALTGAASDCVKDTAQRFRLTSGAIVHCAIRARAWAAVRGGDPTLRMEDIRRAAHALNRQALETLAQPIDAEGSWADLALRPSTLEELMLLESRCRFRERLADSLEPVFSPHAGGGASHGVRALFSGPSGTGKTLAARILAAALEMDLYRVDLSAVVNKYIGETEKNLNELLTRAEELDVVLLIDEGDSLLTQRTSVQTSNDRYANLETNFLLQRLESYSGIVVITTNAGERIDSAFQRRMDVVIEFRPPEPAERWAIWQLHLPPEHGVDPNFLRQVAERCALNGGQIRNVVLHATVLALADGGGITSHHFEAAVRREYRKLGAVNPMKAQYS